MIDIRTGGVKRSCILAQLSLDGKKNTPVTTFLIYGSGWYLSTTGLPSTPSRPVELTALAFELNGMESGFPVRRHAGEDQAGLPPVFKYWRSNRRKGKLPTQSPITRLPIYLYPEVSGSVKMSGCPGLRC